MQSLIITLLLLLIPNQNDNDTPMVKGYDRISRQTHNSVAGAMSQYSYYGPTWMRSNAVTSQGSTSYVYDGFACVAQTTSGTTTHYAVGGNAPMWETTNGATQVYAKNGRGNITGLINSSSQYTVKYGYNAFGEMTIESGTDSNIHSSKPGYHGQLHDEGTGQVFLRNRYYTPSLGRFMQSDPIGYGDGPNTYGYAHGDPVNGWDPMGTKIEAVLAKGNNGKPEIEIWYQPEFFYADLHLLYASRHLLWGRKKLGTLDSKTGFVNLTNGRQTTMSYLKEWDQSYTGRTGWFAQRSFFTDDNKTWNPGALDDGGNVNLKPALYRKFKQLEEIGGVKKVPTPDEIFQAADLSAGLVEDLLLFYVSMPFELAQASKLMRALEYADTITQGGKTVSKGKAFDAMLGGKKAATAAGLNDKQVSIIRKMLGRYHSTLKYGDEADKVLDALTKQRRLAGKIGPNEVVRGGFNWKTGAVYLRSDASRLEKMHEVLHAIHRKKVGYEAYKGYDTLKREEWVFNKLRNSMIWDTLSETEQISQLDYIKRVRDRYAP